MIGLIRSLLGRKAAAASVPASSPVALDLPEDCWAAGTRLPIPDWEAVAQLAPPPGDAAALHAFWRSAVDAWLRRLAQALGEDDYRVSHSEHFALLAPLSLRECTVTLDFAERVHRRILQALPGVAGSSGYGPEAVLLFDNPDEYYAYIDHYYPSEGVFAMSSGMFVDAGYGHFVFEAENVAEMEPVLVHEHTHALLAHLDLPRWLDEGAAVNMEKYLVPHLADPRRNLYSPREMAEKHAAFWNGQTLQEFWTGHSFGRPDDGNLLSYDLAERLTRLLSVDNYPRYAELLLHAERADGGYAALRDAYGLEAGDLVAEVLGPGPWQPLPASWPEVAARAAAQSQQRAQALLADDADAALSRPDDADWR